MTVDVEECVSVFYLVSLHSLTHSLSLSLLIVSTVSDKLQKEMTIALAEKENQFQQQVIINLRCF